MRLKLWQSLALVLAFACSAAQSVLVSTLPTCEFGKSQSATVADGSTTNDCSTGGGSFEVSCLCINGRWQALQNLPHYAVDEFPICTDGFPLEVMATDGASSTDCSTGGGSTEVPCCCLDGAWGACSSGGGGSGDITDVWSATSGNVNALTAAAGDSLDATSADSMIPWPVGTTATPTTEGSAKWDSDDDRLAVGNSSGTKLFYPGAHAGTGGSDGGAANDLACTTCVDTTDIAANAVTVAKMQQISTDSLLGRDTTGTGNVENIGLGTGLAMDGAGNLRVTTTTVDTIRPPNFDTPPASAGAYDDEFSSTTLDASWSAPCSAGTVDPTSTRSDAVYDLTSWPGAILFQGYNSTNPTSYDFTKSVTLATNSTTFLKLTTQGRPFSGSGSSSQVGSGEANVTFLLANSGGVSSDNVGFQLQQTGTGFVPRFFVTNGGVSTVLTGPTSAAAQYAVIIKKTNTYYLYVLNNDGGISYAGTVTKTGTTTLDTYVLRFNSSNDTITPIMGCDFVRYYPTATWALKNP